MRFGTMKLSGAALALLLLGCGRGSFLDVPVATRGCRAVDFLFVVDNSESMQPHQDNLRRNFGPFVEGIQNSLTEVDSYHVGVVTTDGNALNPQSCRITGSLVQRTESVFPASCGPFEEGYLYMTERDELAAGFDCIADVGVMGSRDEQPIRALRRAIGWGRNSQTEHPEYGNCVGPDYIRDDALLVTVLVTDEEHGLVPTEDTPELWHRWVSEAKGGDENAVVISLINGAETGCLASDRRFDARNLADFTRRFPHGYVGGICEPDYGPIFDEATSVIEEACERQITIVDNVGE